MPPYFLSFPSPAKRTAKALARRTKSTLADGLNAPDTESESRAAISCSQLPDGAYCKFHTLQSHPVSPYTSVHAHNGPDVGRMA